MHFLKEGAGAVISCEVIQSSGYKRLEMCPVNVNRENKEGKVKIVTALKMQLLHVEANGLLCTAQNSLITNYFVTQEEYRLKAIGKLKQYCGLSTVSKTRFGYLGRVYDDERTKLQRQSDMVLNKLLAETPSKLAISFIKVNCAANKLKCKQNYSKEYVNISLDSLITDVEVRDNPELRNRPFAVHFGSQIHAANEQARALGIFREMKVAEAIRIGTNITLIPCHFDKYIEASDKLKEILEQYSEYVSMTMYAATFEITSFIEEFRRNNVNAESQQILADLQDKIYKKVGIMVCIGAGPTPLLAKFATYSVRPKGYFYIEPNVKSVKSFTCLIRIEECGLSPMIEVLLRMVGVCTTQDAWNMRGVLYNMLPQQFFWRLIEMYLGVPLYSNDTKGNLNALPETIIQERSFYGTSSLSDLKKILHGMIDDIANEIVGRGLVSKSIALTVVTAEFATIKLACDFDQATNVTTTIANQAFDFLTVMIKENGDIPLMEMQLELGKLQPVTVKPKWRFLNTNYALRFNKFKVDFGKVRPPIVPRRRVKTLIPSNRLKTLSVNRRRKTLTILSSPNRFQRMSNATCKQLVVRPIVGKLAERKRNSWKRVETDDKKELRVLTNWSFRPKFGIGYICPNCNTRINIRNKAQIEIVMNSHINYCLTLTHVNEME